MCNFKNDKINIDNIDKLRLNIDVIDDEISILLLKRLSLVEKIGEIKKENHLNILDKKREKEKLYRLKKFSNSKIEENYLSNIYQKIMDESKIIENFDIE